MPTYQYECSACEHHLEAFQKITDDKLVDCPECAEPKLSRLIGSVAVIFKGSWGDKRRKKVEGRLKRQEMRIEHGLKSGKMTQLDVDQMLAIKNKYANKSPYLVEPDELKDKTKRKKPAEQVNYKSSEPPKEPELGGDSRKTYDRPNEV